MQHSRPSEEGRKAINAVINFFYLQIWKSTLLPTMPMKAGNDVDLTKSRMQIDVQVHGYCSKSSQSS
jgi:hypothetical protein